MAFHLNDSFDCGISFLSGLIDKTYKYFFDEMYMSLQSK